MKLDQEPGNERPFPIFQEEMKMLVLSRKKNESIIINGEVRIEVLQIKGNQVRLGIVAPTTMKILRSELPPSPVCVKEPPGDYRKDISRSTESRFSQIIDCEMESSIIATLQV